MNTKALVLPLLGALVIGCERRVVEVRPQREVVVEPAAPVYVAPAYVEEGATVGGVVVVPAPVDSYVVIGGEWYYWHPALRCWVHAHRAAAWHPGPEVRVYRSWGEHPMYHAERHARREER